MKGLVEEKEALILFGGRGRNRESIEEITTFDVKTIRGQVTITTYDEKPLEQTFPQLRLPESLSSDNSSSNSSKDEPSNKYINPYFELFNDIWAYDLEASLWKLISPNVPYGGCKNVDNEQICSHPQERYRHTAQIVRGKLLVVYSGYSLLCGDFCNDIWFYFLETNGTWIEKHVHFTPTTVTSEGIEIENESIFTKNLTKIMRKRWKANSFVSEDNTIFIFGGQSVDQKINTTFDEQAGPEETGKERKYLDDLWSLNLTQCLDFESMSRLDRFYYLKTCKITLKQIKKKRSCTKPNLNEKGELKVNAKFIDRNIFKCEYIWPESRSLAAIGSDESNLKTYLFGGYKTPEYYPNSEISLRKDRKTTEEPVLYPYPKIYAFLDDLWVYDHISSSWTFLESKGNYHPQGRSGSQLFVTKEYIYLIGGRTNSINSFLNDIWLFNLDTQRWLKKPHLIYPQNDKFINIHYDLQHSLTSKEEFYSNFTKINKSSEFSLVFDHKTQIAYIYGGHSTSSESESTSSESESSSSGVLSSLWKYELHKCHNNCSSVGYCYHNNCYCQEGYSKFDCSFENLPNTLCFHDVITEQLYCSYCSLHNTSLLEIDFDLDYNLSYSYLPRNRLLQNFQSRDLQRENEILIPERYVEMKFKQLTQIFSRAVSYDKGSCECQSGWKGPACEFESPTCVNNCNNRGSCLLDSRTMKGECVCDGAYYGSECQYKYCLNDCSFPRGVCDKNNGRCSCMSLLDIYNNSLPWREYASNDCSIVIPYSSSPSHYTFPILSSLSLLTLLLFIFIRL